VSANAATTVIRELREAVDAVDAAIAADAKASRASSRAAATHRRTSTAVAAATEKRDRLAEAADLLAPDWREWEWIRRDGLGAKVPRPAETHS